MHAVVFTSHLIVPRRLRVSACHCLGLLQGLFTTEPFPAIVLAPLLPACWAVRLLVQSAGSIAVVNYLVPALFVSRKDLWGERILPGDFHLLCAHRLAPSPPPGPHPSAALSTYILSHLRPPMPFLPPLLPLRQTRVEVNGEDV